MSGARLPLEAAGSQSYGSIHNDYVRRTRDRDVNLHGTLLRRLRFVFPLFLVAFVVASGYVYTLGNRPVRTSDTESSAHLVHPAPSSQLALPVVASNQFDGIAAVLAADLAHAAPVVSLQFSEQKRELTLLDEEHKAQLRVQELEKELERARQWQRELRDKESEVLGGDKAQKPSESSPFTNEPPPSVAPGTAGGDKSNIFLNPYAPHGPADRPQEACAGPYDGYPECQGRVDWLRQNWNSTRDRYDYYSSRGVDGSLCSLLDFLNDHGFYCPESVDASKEKIRGVNMGGWLVLEPWITPSLWDQFDPVDKVMDMWSFCERLGKDEARRQLEAHWNSWVTEEDISKLAAANVNHLRVPVGYWIMGDIRQGEPWVMGGMPFLQRLVQWCKKYGLHMVIDLHCAPGSQNGFDNSGRLGDIRWADPFVDSNGKTRYPNIERTLKVINDLAYFASRQENGGVVVAIELINEAFISIPLEIVKQFYLDGYDIIKSHGEFAVVIGDSFRFGSWDGFMFPPRYRHVWIDTHIYQVFDAWILSRTWQQHMDFTCNRTRPEVAVAPLSTMVGEFSLGDTDCALWLNGYGRGARYDGTFGNGPRMGSCEGQNDIKNSTVFSKQYRQFLREWFELQTSAYESGSSEGWFFWNFKTERAPQWNYLMGVEEGWITTDFKNRKYTCPAPLQS